MLVVVKDVSELSEYVLKHLINKFIHVPINKFLMFDEVEGKEIEENVWFMGRVAGYEKAVSAYDFIENKFVKECVYYSVLLTDGKGYALSTRDLVIEILSEKEYFELLAEKHGEEAFYESTRDILDKLAEEYEQ